MGSIIEIILSKLQLIEGNIEPNNIYINDMNEDDIDKLCLKIHILGSGDKMKLVIDNIFKQSVSNIDLKQKFQVNRQFKTEQFHWIAHTYENEKVNNDLCKKIKEEIDNDKKNDKEGKIILKNEVIICFGNENTEIISKVFRKINIIYITEKKSELYEKMDKRYAINIIYKNDDNLEISDKKLNAQIISTLWELDCYYKEKGNINCRYTPENIFQNLEKDNSIFSINILLTGLSRVGKSTFINLLSRKLNALESNLAVSVTKNISEYYIYREDGKNEHGAIKLIDTPGIVKDKDKEDKNYKDKEKKVIELIKKKEKSFENRIHFIFFILMDGRMSPDGDNVKKVFHALNETKCPVFFIINKIKKTADFNEKIRSLKEFFNNNGFNKLSKDENFIQANFLEGSAGEIYGIDTIFGKILEYIDNKKIFEENLKKEMESLLKDFRSNVESDISFLPLKKEDLLTIKEKKNEIDFEKRITKIKEMIKNNELFSNFDIGSLLLNGKSIASKTKDYILSLSNIKDILPDVYQNLSINSIYQAFMVKEIGEGYKLDINILNFGTKIIFKYLEKFLPLLDKGLEKEIKKGNNKEDFEFINKINIEEYNNIDQETTLEHFENLTKNNNTISSIASILDRLKKANLKKGEKIDENSNNKLTVGIFKYCILFFEREITESEGLSVMMNYFNKLQSLLNDIKYYKQKQDWKNFEMQVKNI